MKSVRIIMTIVALAIAGCASPLPSGDGGSATIATRSFVMDLPGGWFRSPLPPDEDKVTLVREGDTVQKWTMEWEEWNGRILRGTRSRTVISSELALRLVLGWNREAGPAWFDIVSLQPAVVASREAFRVEYLSQHIGAPARRTVLYGVPQPRGIYVMTFDSIDTYFFERDIAAFESTVRSLRFVDQK